MTGVQEQVVPMKASAPTLMIEDGRRVQEDGSEVK